jgi:hypothetical protein
MRPTAAVWRPEQPRTSLRRRAVVPTVLLLLALSACTTAGSPPDTAHVVLPMSQAWVDGYLVDYISTDTSDAAMARDKGLHFVPRLADALPAPGTTPGRKRSLVERVYAFPDGSQRNVFASAPRPSGAGNADPSYSPLWRMVTVRWVRASARRELRSEEAILQAQDQGDLALVITDIVINCPIVRSVDGQALRNVR